MGYDQRNKQRNKGWSEKASPKRCYFSWGPMGEKDLAKPRAGERTFQAVGTENLKSPRWKKGGHFQKGGQCGLVNKRQPRRKQVWWNPQGPAPAQCEEQDSYSKCTEKRKKLLAVYCSLPFWSRLVFLCKLSLGRWVWVVEKCEMSGEPTVEHRELYSVLCGDLNGKEIQKRGDICIRIADSLCCTAETNTTL